MKTQDKLDAIKDVAIVGYESKLSHDDICGAVLPLALEKDIGFGEISSLVKNIGENNGFITKLADRKTNAQLDVKAWGELPDIYEEMVRCSNITAEQNNIPKSYVLNIVKGEYKVRELPVPEKSEILEWQQAMVDCFLENPKMNKLDVHDCVIKFKKETSIPKSMLAMLQYMHKQLVNV